MPNYDPSTIIRLLMSMVERAEGADDGGNFYVIPIMDKEVDHRLELADGLLRQIENPEGGMTK